MKQLWPVLLVSLFWVAAHGGEAAEADRWSEEQAKAWYAKQGWLVGSNY